MWTAFSYIYRDASNYKASSIIYLSGKISKSQRRAVEGFLFDGEWFVAEQVGVPPLQDRLGEPTADDHGFHEFEGWETYRALPEDVSVHSSLEIFIRRFASVNEWNLDLSPIAHATLG